jgi:predicted SAM-dependent methyltransferase
LALLVAVIVERLSLAYAKLKRNRRVKPPAAPVKVNLGAGVNVAPGWLNIDVNASALAARLPPQLIRHVAYRFSNVKRSLDANSYVDKLKEGVFVHHNLIYGIPLDDDTADIIYSSHFFEHLYRDDTERLLRDVRRVLKPGGVFRINVPDVTPWVEALKHGDTEAGLDGLFPRSARAAGGELGTHRYMYDFELLARLLKEAGFTEIHRCERQEGTVPDLQVLEHRSPSGIYVEAS